jgi:hypothetical protein
MVSFGVEVDWRQLRFGHGDTKDSVKVAAKQPTTLYGDGKTFLLEAYSFLATAVILPEVFSL